MEDAEGSMGKEGSLFHRIFELVGRRLFGAPSAPEPVCYCEAQQPQWHLAVRTLNEIGDISRFGTMASIVYDNSTDRGIFSAFREVQMITHIRIRRVDDGLENEYELVNSTGSMSLYDTIIGCGVTDAYVTSPTSLDWTSAYSGTLVSGNLSLATVSTGGNAALPYMFICGVNTMSDTDHSILAFCDNTGNSNGWGDSWRGIHQYGTVWSLYNDDYKAARGWASIQGWPGYKGNNYGVYEVWIFGHHASVVSG